MALQNIMSDKNKCKKCGACCEIAGCDLYDKKTKLCKHYKNRPVYCRVKYWTDVTEAACESLRALREGKDVQLAKT